MRTFLATTIISCLFAVVSFGLVLLFVNSEGGGPYIMIALFSSCILPTAIGVCIFYLIKWRVSFSNSLQTFLIHILLLMVTFQAILFLWALLEALFGLDHIKDPTIQKVMKVYSSEFHGFNMIALILAIIIPCTYKLLERKTRPNQV